jgi:hypothetical protein
MAGRISKMTLTLFEGKTYIRAENGDTMAVYDADNLTVEIKRGSRRVLVDIPELLAQSGLEIAPVKQKFDNSK